MIWETRLHHTLISKIKHKLYKQPVLWTWVNPFIYKMSSAIRNGSVMVESTYLFSFTHGFHRYWLLRRRSWGRAVSSPGATVGCSSQHYSSRTGHSQRETTLSYTLDPAEQTTTKCLLSFNTRLLLIIKCKQFKSNYISVHFAVCCPLILEHD